jgi:isopentenyldiphosphate isomerase
MVDVDTDEHLEVVSIKGEVIGYAPRAEIHGNPSLIHRVIHVLVFNKKGELLLQKRSQDKDVAPGKWDTSVGGHVGIGEELLFSSGREMHEELGITGCELEHLYSYIHSNSYETELVTTYRCIYEGNFSFNKSEIEEIRFWSFDQIKEALGRKILSDNFEHEFRSYLSYFGNGSPPSLFS